jgi:hypothetical protein
MRFGQLLSRSNIRLSHTLPTRQLNTTRASQLGHRPLRCLSPRFDSLTSASMPSLQNSPPAQTPHTQLRSYVAARHPKPLESP